jgi:hypothetical protein
MAVIALEQQARQRHPLSRRAQAGLAQAGGEVETGTGHWQDHM